MKKTAFCLIAMFAVLQSSLAFSATSALTESILEYNAILSSINGQFPEVIPSTEFIVDIARKTKKIAVFGEVKYVIQTCTISNKNKCKKSQFYLATINVARNIGVGPNMITVISIEPLKSNDGKSG